MAFRWRADDVPTLNAVHDQPGVMVSFVICKGIRTSIAKKPYMFVIFQGVGSGPPVSPLSGSAHAY